jgi:hypothetical protein
MESNTIPVATAIDNIVRENKIFRFASELECCTNEIRKNNIRLILRSLQDKSEEKAIKARENITSLCNKITEAQLKKKWIRLTLDQKVSQITKYYEGIEEDEDTQKELIKKAFDLLEAGKLKSKMITYDEKEGKIVNINLEFKEPKKKKNVSEKSDSVTSSDSD